jgi:hypothetical protein
MPTSLTLDTARSNDGKPVLIAAGEIDLSAAINALFGRADRIRLIAHPLLMSVLSVSGLAELVTIEPAPPTAQH